MGLYVFYFGTRKKYKDIEHHTIYLGKSHKQLLNKIFNSKELDDDFSFIFTGHQQPILQWPRG